MSGVADAEYTVAAHHPGAGPEPAAGRIAARIRRLAVVGAISAGIVCLAVLTNYSLRFGWSEQATIARVEREVRAEFNELASTLHDTATSLAGRRDLIARTSTDADAARALFEVVQTATAGGAPDLAATIYGPTGSPLAWSGRPSEIPPDRISGPRSLFVAPGPLGLRLVFVEPVTTGGPGDEMHRIGTVAAERVVSPGRGVGPAAGGSFLLPTSIATVSLRTRYEGAGERPGRYAFLIRSPGGEPLLEARISPSELSQSSSRRRGDLIRILLVIVAGTVIAIAGELLNWRARARSWSTYIRATFLAVVVIVGARALLWLATPARWTARALFSPAAYASTAFGSLLRSPIDFLLTAIAVLSLVAVAADAVYRVRIGARRWRRSARADGVRFTAAQVAAGMAVAALILAYELFLSDTIDNTSIDVLHFSLHPWNSARVALLIGLLLFHVAVVWVSILLLVAALIPWRPERPTIALRLLVAWGVSAGLLIVVVAFTSRWRVPATPILPVAAFCMAAAYGAPRLTARYRHGSQAGRLVALFLALVIPSMLLYPAVFYFAERAKRRLIEKQYAFQAMQHAEELQTRLSQSLEQIDRIPALPELIASLSAGPGGATQTDSAFLIWQQTDLARFRLTSAIELYGSDGSLVSRFALNLPEYTSTAQRWQGTQCTWEVFGEAPRFGAEERRMLHAERGICTADQKPVGAIIVHVMLDYSALPFLTSQSPYFEFFRTTPSPPQEGMPGGDVELVIYGWGRMPVYTSGTGAWPIDETLFRRIYASRQPFWTMLARRNVQYWVYVSNDRAGIYALGYPRVGLFGHLVRLAELATLAGVAFVLLVSAAALFSRVAGRSGSGRRLLREVRASFYRKLFLAFVAASVVPVLILALTIRTYFASILRTDVESEAAKTAAVAQRVIEESVALQQRGPEALTTVNDDVMVWISQVIGQDVNIFAGPHLVATSERDLFASGLLPTRTPDAVYREIVLQRLPSFVGEDAIGPFKYMLAAAPLRLPGQQVILTVPLALRQQEIEREIDEFDRGVYLAALVFILLGAGIGFSMAERIADPVKRLTRASQRIARGDLTARVAVKTADELRRLVDDFNRMASELSRQAAQLQRTHRLEAWAEMARQVAHEIKNPLTPIQLSAEHLRRVHQDRGEPLSPVLESCIDSILTQVRLLRQISAEFSSFATAPTPRPVAVSLADLVNDVISPYESGLAGRIVVSVDVAASLPPVHIDKTLIARALTNVIENALHAMPGTGSLSISATAEQGGVRLTVADTGVGMDDEALARIFEPYFSTKAIGTGLGLTIAKRNVELNGGTIEVHSSKANGTIVILTLPVSESSIRPSTI